VSDWRKARDRLKKRKCGRGPRCRACKEYQEFLLAVEFRAAYWLMDSMWAQLHQKLLLS